MEYEEYLKTIKNSLRDIQTSVLITNESDDKGSSDDADLDALLKGGSDSGSDSNDSTDNKDSSMPDLSDLGLDNKDGENKDSENKEDDKSLDNLDLEKPDDEGSDKNFETDSEGLIDTITKLTKAGKTVKILVSAEGKQYFEVNGRKINNFKQLSELANKSVKGGLSMQENKVLSALYGQLKSMKAELNELKGNRTSLTEDRMIKIPESKYIALTEMNDDLTRKVEEQGILIKNYQSYRELTESNENESIENMLNTLSETIDETNKVINSNTFNNGLFLFNKGRSIALDTLTEDVMPILHSLNDIRSSLLSEVDMAEASSNVIVNNTVSSDINPIIMNTMNKLDRISESICTLGRINKLTSLIESKMYNKQNFTRAEILRILDEASDMVVIPEPEAEFNNLPTTGYPYSGLQQRIKSILQTAMSSANYKSQMFIAPEDSNGNMMSRSISNKFDLPLYKPEKYNVTTTVKSAILNLAESLTDIDGNLDVEMAKKAYLYKKTSKPTSLKDFAFPIAICENKKLYAHPELIKTAANILKDDKCMKVYGIDSRETLYQLRESLNPYLEAIKVDIPWLALDESKKAKSKKSKCKECGAECDNCSKDGLCPDCEKEAKKTAKKKGKK